MARKGVGIFKKRGRTVFVCPSRGSETCAVKNRFASIDTPSQYSTIYIHTYICVSIYALTYRQYPTSLCTIGTPKYDQELHQPQLGHLHFCPGDGLLLDRGDPRRLQGPETRTVSAQTAQIPGNGEREQHPPREVQRRSGSMVFQVPSSKGNKTFPEGSRKAGLMQLIPYDRLLSRDRSGRPSRQIATTMGTA